MACTIDVLILLRLLELAWIPPLLAAILYAISFAIPRLNSSAAIAVTAMCSTAVVALVFVVSLLRISL